MLRDRTICKSLRLKRKKNSPRMSTIRSGAVMARGKGGSTQHTLQSTYQADDAPLMAWDCAGMGFEADDGYRSHFPICLHRIVLSEALPRKARETAGESRRFAAAKKAWARGPVACRAREPARALEWRAVRRLVGATFFRRCGVAVPTKSPPRVPRTNWTCPKLLAWPRSPNCARMCVP